MSLKLMRDVYAHAHSSQAKGCAVCTPVGRAVLLAIIFIPARMFANVGHPSTCSRLKPA